MGFARDEGSVPGGCAQPDSLRHATPRGILSFRGAADHRLAIEAGLEHLGHVNPPIRALVVLEDRDEAAGGRRTPLFGR